MEWPRVKTILIFLLLAVNVFLFCAYAGKSIEMSRNEEQIREQVCRVMSGMGYELSTDVLPADSQFSYPARITRDVEGEQRAVDLLFGKTEVETGVGSALYTGKTGEMSLKSGGYIEGNISISDECAGDKECIKLSREKMALLGADIVSPSVSAVSDKTVVEAVCAVARKPVFNCRVKCVIDSGKMEFSGRIPIGQVEFIQSITPRDVSGLMFNFAEEMKKQGVLSGEIESMVSGYVVNSATEFESGAAELVPVWKIYMGGKEYYINALNGTSVLIE